MSTDHDKTDPNGNDEANTTTEPFKVEKRLRRHASAWDDNKKIWTNRTYTRNKTYRNCEIGAQLNNWPAEGRSQKYPTF